jgi:hypothetical protein
VNVLGLSEGDWNAIGAIATAVAALATAFLAGATYWLARTTRDELHQTKRVITATEKQAEASTKMLAEVQTDRDLNWRPYLILHQTSWASDAQGNTDKVWLKNIGRGPAFNAVCARLIYITASRGGVTNQVPLWRLSVEVPQTLEANGVHEFSLQGQTSAATPLVLFEVNPSPQPTLSIFYQDIGGKRAYRLTHLRAAPDVWTPGDKVEPWVSWYFSQIGLQVPN